jgi:hypothetical protein
MTPKRKSGRPRVPPDRRRRHLVAAMLTDAEAAAFARKTWLAGTTRSQQLRVFVNLYIGSVTTR